jgi:hypothetical protein
MNKKVNSENDAGDRVPPDLRMMRSPQVPESRERHCQGKYEEKSVRKSEPASRQQEVAELQQAHSEYFRSSPTLD